MNLSKNIIKNIINIIVIIAIILAIIFSFIYRLHIFMGKHTNYLFVITITIALICILLAIFKIYINLWNKLNKKINILILAFLIISIRLFYILLVPTKPVSDFNSFYSYAINASKGFFKGYDMTFTLFRFRFGYSLVLASIFKIFGSSVLVGKLFNVFLSGILGLIIYSIVKYLFDEKAALLSVLLYAFWPSQIMYNADLASEHVFIIFFMLGIYFSFKSLKEKKLKFACFSGLMFALANNIRPVAIIMVIAFIIYSIFNISKRSIEMAVSFTVSYFVAFYFICFIIFRLSGVPAWETSMGLNLMIGTDYTTYGMNNPKHSRFVEKYNYDFHKMHGDAMKIGIDRLKNETNKFINMLPRKHSIIWGDDSFGYFWSTFRVYYDNWFVNIIKKHPTIMFTFSQIYYYAILVFIIFGLIKSRKEELTLFMSIGFLGYLITHIFLEVQPRYHYPGIFLLFIVSGNGAMYLIKKFQKDLNI